MTVPASGDNDPTGEEEEIHTPLDIDTLFHLIGCGDDVTLVEMLNDEEILTAEMIAELLAFRNNLGKSALDFSAELGRLPILKELIQRGADITLTTSHGYTPIHYATVWGHVNCLRELYFTGADIEQRTGNDERPYELAQRYNQQECIEFLEWADARNELLTMIQTIRETNADPEKHMGRITKDERKTTEAACTERETWMNNTPTASLPEIKQKNKDLIDLFDPILIKLSEPLAEKK